MPIRAIARSPSPEIAKNCEWALHEFGSLDEDAFQIAYRIGQFYLHAGFTVFGNPPSDPPPFSPCAALPYSDLPRWEERVDPHHIPEHWATSPTD